MKDVKLNITTKENVTISFGRNKHLSPLNDHQYEIGISKPARVRISINKIMNIIDKIYELYILEDDKSFDSYDIKTLLEYYINKEEYVNTIIKYNPSDSARY